MQRPGPRNRSRIRDSRVRARRPKYSKTGGHPEGVNVDATCSGGEGGFAVSGEVCMFTGRLGRPRDNEMSVQRSGEGPNREGWMGAEVLMVSFLQISCDTLRYQIKKIGSERLAAMNVVRSYLEGGSGGGYYASCAEAPVAPERLSTSERTFSRSNGFGRK